MASEILMKVRLEDKYSCWELQPHAQRNVDVVARPWLHAPEGRAALSR